MGEVKMMVPAEYAETLRRAVVGEVKFWTDAMKRDEKDLRDAREGPPEPDKVALTYKQLGNHQKNLATVGVLVDQVPCTGREARRRASGFERSLRGVSEEAMRLCIKGIAHENEYAPLDGEALRKKMGELEWWIGQEEAHAAARLAGDDGEAI